MAVVRKRGTSRTSGRKTPAGKKEKKTASIKTLGALFWVVFIIVIFCLFVINWGKIQQTLADSQIYERLVNRDRSGEENPQPQLLPPEVIIEVFPPEGAANITPVTRVEDTPPQTLRTSSETSGNGQTQTVPAVQTPSQQTTTAPVQETPAGQTTSGGSLPQTPALRERSLYLIRIDSEGDVYRVKVNRQLPVSDSPLVDVLNSLFAGPTREEQNSGFVSLIPGGSRILPGQTTVRGGTAYISLSEEFQYNTYGVEGYAASLRQIIWTVTEFPNIEDVQILIEGRRIDYLGEGIWIGSPVNRRF